jgi:hypothetical protein
MQRYPPLKCHLNIIERRWEKPKCSAPDEWVKKMIHLYHGILFSHKQNEILLFATEWMEPEIIMLSEIS